MRNNIDVIYGELESLYPEAGYASRATIFRMALNDEIITEEEYDRARSYYGRLWNYTGD